MSSQSRSSWEALCHIPPQPLFVELRSQASPTTREIVLSPRSPASKQASAWNGHPPIHRLLIGITLGPELTGLGSFYNIYNTSLSIFSHTVPVGSYWIQSEGSTQLKTEAAQNVTNFDCFLGGYYGYILWWSTWSLDISMRSLKQTGLPPLSNQLLLKSSSNFRNLTLKSLTPSRCILHHFKIHIFN